ncbi:MAG: MgtC/SapB family protein, partial [Gammaproteobacteria bacterium]|nr:MgtC/SapB family protein [Gammaproteobacteria bacterium]
MELFERLAVALAIGLLIGIERGWHEREAGEGRRIAGLRTFGIIGLLGAVSGLLADELGELLLAATFIAFAALVIAAHVLESREDRDFGMTTPVAALLTFTLGTLAALGYTAVAGATAVVTATLLGLKPLLHRWIEQMEQRELYAIFKMLMISVVLLPILPNQGYGPWQALNPYEIWWMVVLIAGISFAGYFAVKIAGSRRGLVITGLFGGLASSTALTLSFARLGRHNRNAHSLLAAGVVLAAGTMFPRMLLEVSVINPQLLPALTIPLLSMMLASYLAVPLLLFSSEDGSAVRNIDIQNPFELLPALKFGLLLVAVLLLAEFFLERFGNTGLYAIAAISGLTDVDAITLSISRMARGDLSAGVATQAIIIAASVNTLVKGVLVAVICGRAMAWKVMLSIILAIAAGAITT